MVYLLGKVGDNKKALNLIIERLDDVKGVSSPSVAILHSNQDGLTSIASLYRLSSSQKRGMIKICGRIF